MLGVRLGRLVLEVVVEDDDVLLALKDCVLFPELVELLLIAALLVYVFVEAPLRDPVEEADDDLLADIVRVLNALPVLVFEAVIVAVCVAVFLTEDERAEDREILALAVLVFEALTERVLLELLEEVLDGTIEREPLGELDDVFEELTDPVVVFEDVVVFVDVVVDVIVLVIIAVTVILGLAVGVLDAAALRESSTVAFMLFVDVVLGVTAHVGPVLLVPVVVFVEVFEDIGLRVGIIAVSTNMRAEVWEVNPNSANNKRDSLIPYLLWEYKRKLSPTGAVKIDPRRGYILKRGTTSYI